MAFGIFLLIVLPSLCIGEIVKLTTAKSGCVHHDGKTYPAGSTFSPTPCEHCVCPSHGGQAYCAIVDCAMPACVDAMRKSDQCCSTCPNGPNCYLGGKIIPAGQDFEEGEKVCRCPRSHMGLGFGSSNTQAECSLRAPDPTSDHIGPRH